MIALLQRDLLISHLQHDRLIALLEGQRIVVLHRRRAVVIDLTGLVVLHFGLQILLGVDEDLLTPLFVLQPDLVEIVGPAALRAPGLEAALRLVGGQRVGRRLVGVVNPARDDGAVEVAFDEVDDHLLADPWDLDEPPVFARPGARDTHPTGAGFVLLPVAVPMELHLHAPVAVHPDLFAGLTHDDGGLGSRGNGLHRGPGRAEGDVMRDRVERVLVIERLRVTAGIVADPGRMVHAHELICLVDA